MEDGERHPDPGDGDLAQVEDVSRYASFRDYVVVVRRHWLLIAGITAIFAGGAFVYSATRSDTYEATASLLRGNLPADFALVGLDGAPELAGNPVVEMIEVLEGPEVARQARSSLATTSSRAAADTPVTVQLGPGDQAVLQARASDPAFVTALVDAYARAGRAALSDAERDRLARAESLIGDRIEEAQQDDELSRDARLPGLQAQLSRLRTLSEVAEPPRIIQPARVSLLPAEPLGDTVLGALGGLVVGLAVAFGRVSLDRRLHTAEEVHRELGLPVLARISDDTLGSAGLATSGARPVTAADFEAFRVLRMNLDRIAAKRALRSILVTSGRPEEGKSTVSMALASASALAGQRTLLVECDPRRPCFAERLGISHQPGLTDYLLGAVGPAEILQTVELGEPAVPGESDRQPEGSPVATLACIAAGTPVRSYPELLTSARFRGFIAKVSKVYDRVVLDASPLLLVVDSLEIAALVDGTIVCVRAHQTTRDEARAAAIALLPRSPVGVVVTGVRRGGPDSPEYGYGY